MTAAFFAILLSIAQAAPPVPRQPIKDHTENAGKSSDVHAQKYEPWTRADELSLAYDILTGLLVIIGGFGVCYALRTLRAIERQTSVLAESQRPRIVVDVAEDPSKTFADESARRVKLRVTNKGMTPAVEYRYESWIEILPDTSGDFTSSANHFKFDTTSVLYPNTPQAINIPLGAEISPDEFLEVKQLRRYVCVRLYAEYDDPFIPSRRCYADFGFYLIAGGLGFLDKHNRVGHKKAED